MFELILHEDYEDNADFRQIERAHKEAEERKQFEKEIGLKKSKTKYGETMYRSTGSNNSKGSKSARDPNEISPQIKRPPKLNTIAAAKRQFAKQGTFTFGESSPFGSARSPQTAKLLGLKKAGTIELGGSPLKKESVSALGMANYSSMNRIIELDEHEDANEGTSSISKTGQSDLKESKLGENDLANF